jgi:hypothetical protein
MVLVEPSLLGLLSPADAEKYRHLFQRIVIEAELNGPVAGLRMTLAIMGGATWARLTEEKKASQLQRLAHMAPLIAPHFVGLLDLAVTDADIEKCRRSTLLIYGAASYPFESAIAEGFTRLHPDLELLTIEGASGASLSR